MYTRGALGQVWVGELLDPVTLLGVEGLAPTVLLALDRSAPYEGTGDIEDLGLGLYRYTLQPDDTEANQVSILMSAEGAIPDRAMILPFDSSSFLLSVEQEGLLVAQRLAVNFIAGTGVDLLVADNMGFDRADITISAPGALGGTVTSVGTTGDGVIDGSVTNPATTPVIDLTIADATDLLRGVVNTGLQTFGGEKTFLDLLNVLATDFSGAHVFLSDNLGNNTSWNVNSVLSVWEIHDSLNTLRSRMTLASFDTPREDLSLESYDGDGVARNACYGVFGADLGEHVGQWTSVFGLDFSGGLLTGGSPSVPWGELTGTPTTLAGYGIFTPTSMSDGGTESNLSTSGPGLLQMTSSGPPTSILAPGTEGYVLTVVSGAWAPAPTATTGVTGTGNINSVAWWDSSTSLSYSSGFDWNPITNTLVLTGITNSSALDAANGSFGAHLAVDDGTGSGHGAEFEFGSVSARLARYDMIAGTAYAGVFTDGTNVTQIGNGVNGVQAAQGSQVARLAGNPWAAEFTDGTFILHLCNGTEAINVNTGNVTFPGDVTGTLNWVNNAFAPTPQVVGAVPLSAFGAGTINDFLGTPDDWCSVIVNGTVRRVPLYTP